MCLAAPPLQSNAGGYFLYLAGYNSRLKRGRVYFKFLRTQLFEIDPTPFSIVILRATSGRGTGDDRAINAARQAIHNGLLDVTIDGARGILFNITGGPNLSLTEVNEAAAIVRESAHPDVHLIFGARIDENMGEEVRITVIATGFEQSRAARKPGDSFSSGNYTGQRPAQSTYTPPPAPAAAPNSTD